MKILAVGGYSWPSIAQFSTIAELKALVDNNASTKNGIARLTQVGQTTKLIINSPTSGDSEFSFEVNESTEILSGYVMNMADPMADAAEHLIVFIESQPE